MTAAALGPDYLLSTGLQEQLAAVLDKCGLGRPARDGDCLTVAPRVTAAVRGLGLPARTVTVTGWLDAAALLAEDRRFAALNLSDDVKIVGFRHEVTVVLGWALDATAQQFHSDLPDRWIIPLDDYLQRLATVCGAACATVEGQPARDRRF